MKRVLIMAYFVPMGKEETGFVTFPLPQKICRSLSSFLTVFLCLESDYGLAETLQAVEITTLSTLAPTQSATGAIIAGNKIFIFMLNTTKVNVR